MPTSWVLGVRMGWSIGCRVCVFFPTVSVCVKCVRYECAWRFLTLCCCSLFPGDVECVREVLTRGGDPNTPNKNGDTPAHIACLKGASLTRIHCTDWWSVAWVGVGVWCEILIKRRCGMGECPHRLGCGYGNVDGMSSKCLSACAMCISV